MIWKRLKPVKKKIRAKGKAIQHLIMYMFLFKDFNINTRENQMGQ